MSAYIGPLHYQDYCIPAKSPRPNMDWENCRGSCTLSWKIENIPNCQSPNLAKSKIYMPVEMKNWCSQPIKKWDAIYFWCVDNFPLGSWESWFSSAFRMMLTVSRSPISQLKVPVVFFTNFGQPEMIVSISSSIWSPSNTRDLVKLMSLKPLYL